MSLFAPAALLMLAAVAVLLALALARKAPRTLDVGTLMIWQRVSQQARPTRSKRRSLEPLLWLLVGAALLAALGAARPAFTHAATAPRVAVYIERLDPTLEPGLLELRARAIDAAPGAELTFFMAGGGDDIEPLNPGSLDAEMAQFMARSGQVDGRIWFLHAPELVEGLALPRVLSAADGVVHEISGGREHVIVRHGPGAAPPVTGAEVTGREPGVLTLRPQAAQVSVGGLALQRERFVVGVGPEWRSDAHNALLASLLPDAGRETPEVWLGAVDERPAIRINAGNPANPETLSFDPGHPLFHDLPVDGLNWGGRVLPPANDAQTLIGSPAGDLVRLRDGGRLLEFAADPFTESPVALSALLLDNAVGVLSGRRASERGNWRTERPLPSRRAAHAAPFAAQGALDLSRRREVAGEVTAWLACAAALLLLAAAWLATQGLSDQRPRPSRRA
jgi:hypothetical protein